MSQLTRHARRAFVLLITLMFVMGVVQEGTLAQGIGQSTPQAGIASPALSLLNALIAANRNRFMVYENSDSGFNKSFPSGFFANTVSVLSKLHLDTACVFDQTSANGCATDVTKIDRLHGTVVRITFDSLFFGEFLGLNWEEPENYGVKLTGVGYDLRGATRVCFDAISLTPSLKVRFGLNPFLTGFMSIPNQWTPICLDLASLGIGQGDLADMHFLFTVVTNDANAPAGGTILLDNIRFEPVPYSQATALSFPLANGVFGVIPVPTTQPGRVAIPPDQVVPNLTTIYESAMAVLVLLAHGTAADLSSARQIADAFVYGLSNDNQGLPIPAAADGSRGLHNGSSSGDTQLQNDQGPGAGKKGQIRLAGFSVTSNLCGPSHYCLVLDGATGGNNAFAMLALEAAYQQFGDIRYLNAARSIGNWIYGTMLDTTGTGFGGYYLGYPDEGQAKVLITGKSIENNADIFRADTTLGDIMSSRGQNAEAQEWYRRAKIAGDFVMALFDSVTGRFYAGTVPSGVSSSPGISPDGPRRGADVINTFDFLDAQTFTTLPLAASPLYRNAIDWRRPVQWMLDHFGQSVNSGGQQFQGFNLVAVSTSGPRGIAWEFTGQAVVTMRFVDALYGEQRFEAQAQQYLNQIRQSQQFSPFTDGLGLVAATIDIGDTLPPYQQCLSTPFQCIASRVGLAATTWGIAADLNVNPFGGPSATPGYTGSIDSASCSGINGWAADKNRLNTSIVVSLWDGSTQIASATANGSRGDVGAVLGDNGLHGFSIPIPAGYFNGVAHTLQVRYGPLNSQLPGSPVTLTCGNSGGANYTGYIDSASCIGINGWAADKNRLNTSIVVSLWDGSTQIASASANGSRGDVGAVLGDNGLHGFSIPIPAGYANGVAHTLQVRYETSNSQLPASPVTLTCGNSGGANYTGYIDSASCSGINGWAADKNRLNTSILVSLWDGSTQIASATASGSVATSAPCLPTMVSTASPFPFPPVMRVASRIPSKYATKLPALHCPVRLQL